MTKPDNIQPPKAQPRLSRVNAVSGLAGYEWATPRTLRQLIFEAEDRRGSGGTVIPGNGLASAILRIGRKVLLDLNLFDLWIETHRCGRNVGGTEQ